MAIEKQDRVQRLVLSRCAHSALDGQGRERERHLEEIKPILQQKLATLEEQKKRLVEAFVYKQAIDEETYRSELDRLRAEITVTRIERNDSELDALDVETVLEFAEHEVLNARRMWSEFAVQHRRRMQKVLFPEGLVYDGEAFRTPVTCLFFRDLERSEREAEELVARTGSEPAASVDRRAPANPAMAAAGAKD